MLIFFMALLFTFFDRQKYPMTPMSQKYYSLKLLTIKKWSLLLINFLIFNTVGISLLTIGLSFGACKKEKESNPSIHFDSPQKMQEYSEVQNVLIRGKIENSSGLHHVKLHLKSPSNTVVASILDQSVEGRYIPFDYTYEFRTSSFKEGKYTLEAHVAGPGKEADFSRQFSYSSSGNNTEGNKIAIWSNKNTLNYYNYNGTVLYSKIFYDQFSASISQKGFVWAYSPSKGILKINNDSLRNEEVIISNPAIGSFESFNSISSQGFYISLRENNGNKLIEFQNQSRVGETIGGEYRIKRAIFSGEFIFTLEQKANNGNDNRFAHYSASTKGLIAGQGISIKNASGLFHFGSVDEVYALVQTSSSSSKIIRYNKSLNSVANIFDISGTPLNTQIIKLESNKILFATSEGLYSVTQGGSLPEKVLVELNGEVHAMKSTTLSSDFGLLISEKGNDEKKMVLL